MGTQRPRRVLIMAEPALLGRVLTEILDAVGEDEVTDASGWPSAIPDCPYSAALVSTPPPKDGIAEVVIVLPGPGDTVGHVHSPAGDVDVDMTAPLSVLDVLDRFCPAVRPRTATAARWGWQANHGDSRDERRPRSNGPADCGRIVTSEG